MNRKKHRESGAFLFGFVWILLSFFEKKESRQRKKQRVRRAKGGRQAQTAPVERGRSLRWAVCSESLFLLLGQSQTAPALWVPFV
ncbi:MAG: hypothetical protein J6J21_00190, partial [Clostridia bacterium]|nr:hypothetical protein [Clostridia bacterium]